MLTTISSVSSPTRYTLRAILWQLQLNTQSTMTIELVTSTTGEFVGVEVCIAVVFLQCLIKSPCL